MADDSGDGESGRAGRAFVTSRGQADGESLTERLMKALSPGGQVSSSLAEEEDEFARDFRGRATAGAAILIPPIAPKRLEEIVLENGAVEPCVAAMEVNVSGTGFDVVHVDKAEGELTEAELAERDQIEAFLNEVDQGTSITALRRALRRDRHITGMAYMVVGRTADGSLALLRRAKAKSMRLVEMDDPVTVSFEVRGQTFTMQRAERRYVQKIGAQYVYYKEYGATRDLDRRTGKWAERGSLPADRRAEEVIEMQDIEDAHSPYGVPRWITQLPSVLGSRRAEEHNLGYFQSGGVPPAMIFISGGVVGEEVERAVKDFMSRSNDDRSRVGVFEVPGVGGIDNEKPASIQVERFGAGASADSDFETYQDKSEERVRRAFRLPKLFIGSTDSVNYASAVASIQIAEDQVFAPERIEEDNLMNNTFMREVDETGVWRIKSRDIRIKDAATQIRALEVLRDTPGADLNAVIGELSRVGAVEVDHSEDAEGNFVPAPSDASSPVAMTKEARTISLRLRNLTDRLLSDPEDDASARQIVNMSARFDRLSADDQEAISDEFRRVLPDVAFPPDEGPLEGRSVVDRVFRMAREVTGED